MQPLADTLKSQMVIIPEGTILLRDDRTDRRWKADIQPFWLGAFPVTQSLYREIVATNPSAFGGENCPVESVSWLDAISFCNQLSRKMGFSESYQLIGGDIGATEVAGSNGFRLPTEAEWEYACRAGTQGPRYGDLNEIAWYRENSGGRPHPVGLKQANAWGLYDMLGNVWEWCSDLYDPEVYGPYRIFRGGGWSDLERGCLATNRRRSHPTFKIDDLGFRLARNYKP
jgi:formylglycine-generating enzyme required for sulfatase activity